MRESHAFRTRRFWFWGQLGSGFYTKQKRVRTLLKYQTSKYETPITRGKRTPINGGNSSIFYSLTQSAVHKDVPTYIASDPGVYWLHLRASRVGSLPSASTSLLIGFGGIIVLITTFSLKRFFLAQTRLMHEERSRICGSTILLSFKDFLSSKRHDSLSW